MAAGGSLCTKDRTEESLMRTLIVASTLMAALVAAPAALAQGSPVCLKGVSGGANCSFQTVAQCEAAKGMNTAAQCITRDDAKSGVTPAGTTGQGAPRQAGPLPGPSPKR
jgi:uncharacterized protein DUF3551